MVHDTKGVSRFTTNLVRQLALQMPSSWEFALILTSGHPTNLPEERRFTRIRIPQLSELANGLLAIPFLAHVLRSEYLLLSSDSVTAIAGLKTIAIVHDIPELIAAAANER